MLIVLLCWNGIWHYEFKVFEPIYVAPRYKNKLTANAVVSATLEDTCRHAARKSSTLVYNNDLMKDEATTECFDRYPRKLRDGIISLLNPNEPAVRVSDIALSSASTTISFRSDTLGLQ